ncbi:prolyl oligopeptidase family protein [Nonomuraea sp. NPDC050328]|uniref:prolyl oligopeptidase family protein n=1 Tax=Nonomuraea sp. NPDC050328 TaxID=3364361 RepID=UPI0037AB1FC5
MTYPPAHRLPLVESLHGHEVADPYRWLEDPADPATAAWLAAQDELWQARAAAMPGRDAALALLHELAADEVSAPMWRGEHRFELRRAAGQEHAVLYRDGVALIDPNVLDPTGATVLDAWQPDLEGRQVAFQLSRGGDERSVLYVADTESGQVVDGPVQGCRYSPVAWLPGGRAFYYVRGRQVWLRRLGGTEIRITDEEAGYGLSLGEDGRWLVVSASSEGRQDVRVVDLWGSRTLAVQEGGTERTAAAVGRDGRLYVLTERDAPFGRLCVADPARPDQWSELVGEREGAVLAGFALLERELLVTRLRDGVAELSVHDLGTGELVRHLPLPGAGSIGAVSTRGREAWFTYTDHVTPVTLLHYEEGSLAGPQGAAAREVVTERLEYPSADGTRVPLLVLSRRGDSGPRPAILYGYGGFGVPLTPAYSSYILAWVAAGGVFALAGVRGGGERGSAWHQAGRRELKHNSVADFVAAAEALVAGGWTTPDRLGACGESNGGLLVGAAITRRPELFAAAVCSSAVLDLVRYERFGMGAAWREEYGTADDPVELGWLLGLSPYHRVRQGVAYPATLLTVAEGDTRVDPLHGRKMCAALQHASAGPGPVLLRREWETGHAGGAASRGAGLAADLLAFLATHTGLDLTSPLVVSGGLASGAGRSG